MVNDDVLIKAARARGHRDDWPEQVRAMRERIREMKLGFPGIGNDHLELTIFKRLGPSDVFIWDPYTEFRERVGDEAPLMMRLLEYNPGKVLIEGIGCGIDSVRDPDRNKLRWMDVISMPSEINNDSLVFKCIARPDLITGGPTYYYWFKSYRDFRY